MLKCSWLCALVKIILFLCPFEVGTPKDTVMKGPRKSKLRNVVRGSKQYLLFWVCVSAFGAEKEV